MKNTAIIIPTRIGAKRFPNKPLANINNVPMIIHVLNRAKESRIGDEFVARELAAKMVNIDPKIQPLTFGKKKKKIL